MSDYVPTIDDLRVKLCYICRDEELYNEPDNPPRVWIHPCRCALIAHESCLLEWLQSAQTRSEQAAENAAKCPQCGTLYEIESRNPLLLRVLSWVSRQLPKVGSACLALGFVSIVASVSAGVYITCTSYGAYAVRTFFGQEVFDYVLTDDPSNWPLMAYIQLPIIPLNLVISQLSHYSPLIHTILACISFTPSLNAAAFPSTNSIRAPSSIWPPSPQLTAVLVIPFVSAFYRTFFERTSRYVLDTPEPKEYDDDPRIVMNPEPLDAGEQPHRLPGITVEIKSPSRIGRHIANGLLIPSIASKMGSLLLRLSLHAPLLRRFLGVRPTWKQTMPLPVPLYWMNADGVRARSSTILRAFWGGISPWAELDPVWWRNTLGYGIFAVARDCLKLLYRWLVKRERESRKVKDRPFTDVDVSNLDLIPSDA